MRYLPLALLLLATPATAQSSGCYGVNCPNSLGDRIVPIPQPRPVVIDVVMTKDKPVKGKHR